MEMFHKTVSFSDIKTVADMNTYTKSLNGRKPITVEETRKIGGGYNAFLQTSLPEELRGYNPAEETVESAHLAFTTTFPRGFALEVLQVYSGPPTIAYKFRHWGYMEGPFKGHAPTGELVELFGIGIFQVDEKIMKVEKVEFFFDRGELLGGLMKGDKVDSDADAAAGVTGCPFLNRGATG
ncbi:Pathogen-related protein [Linum grandiflorum]